MTRGFASVGYVAAIAGAALSCYLVSLRVAAERAQLEEVENRIVLAQRDIRLLQTEIGTRGRLAQLERWNVKVLALSAPKAEQFLEGSFELAKLAAPERKVDLQAPVVLASAPAPVAASPVGQTVAGDVVELAAAPPPAEPLPASRLLHTASLPTDLTDDFAVVATPASARKVKVEAAARPAKAAIDKAAARPVKLAAEKSADNAVAGKAAAAKSARSAIAKDDSAER